MDFPEKITCPDCKNNIVSCERDHAEGYIYILSNPTIQNLFKIGQTKRKPDKRNTEISSATGVATPFIVESYFPSKNPSFDEKTIHDKLNNHRYSLNREFFNATFEDIYKNCKTVTGYDSLEFRDTFPGIDKIDQYDPWHDYRKVIIKEVIVIEKEVIVIEKEFIPRKADPINNNFLCIDCGSSMRPVKKNLQDKGIFRCCNNCMFFVDKLGFEVDMRRK